MIYSLLQHIQQPGSQSFKGAIMSWFFAIGRSKTLTDDQKQIFPNEPSENQPGRRHVHVVLLFRAHSELEPVILSPTRDLGLFTALCETLRHPSSHPMEQQIAGSFVE